jgi:hypothetical protein
MSVTVSQITGGVDGDLPMAHCAESAKQFRYHLRPSPADHQLAYVLFQAAPPFRQGGFRHEADSHALPHQGNRTRPVVHLDLHVPERQSGRAGERAGVRLAPAGGEDDARCKQFGERKRRAP